MVRMRSLIAKRLSFATKPVVPDIYQQLCATLVGWGRAARRLPMAGASTAASLTGTRCNAVTRPFSPYPVAAVRERSFEKARCELRCNCVTERTVCWLAVLRY